MRIHTVDAAHRSLRLPRAGACSLVLAAGLLALAPFQPAHAQTVGASQQVVTSIRNLGQTTIHGGPVSSAAIALPELQPGDDSTVGVKPQTTGGAAPAGASALGANANRHGLAIPGKDGADAGTASSGASLAQASALAAAASLPPPPTRIPNPRGSRVIDAPNSVFGFNGLSHLDQRVAGTGIYTNTQFSLEPPDQALCVGNGFVVEAVNNAISVYDTSGNLLAGPEALSQFWGLTPEVNRTTLVYGQFISDPKCAYDPETHHWFVSELMQDNGTNGGGRNYNLIAVSTSADPRSAFLALGYDVTDDGLNGTPNHAGCPCFGDQPLLGFDGYGIYQSTNEYGATVFNGAQIYAISKQGLIAATHGDFSHLTLVSINAAPALLPYGGLSYSVQPAVASSAEDAMDGSGGGVEFFLSALQFGVAPYGALDNRIAVWALGNTRSLNSSSPSLTLSVKVVASETYGQPNPAQQKSGPTPLGTALGEGLEYLNTNDDRMNQVVFSNGVLYSGVNTLIGDGSRTGIAWFGVHPQYNRGSVSGQVVTQGYVAVDHENVLFPSLAFANDGNGVLGFTLAGPDYYPSAAYVNVGGEGTSSVHVSADGAAPDDGFSGYVAYGGNGVARWGDYSAAVSDGNNVWFATEYIPYAPRTVLADWGTYITKLRP